MLLSKMKGKKKTRREGQGHVLKFSFVVKCVCVCVYACGATKEQMSDTSTTSPLLL